MMKIIKPDKITMEEALMVEKRINADISEEILGKQHEHRID